MDDIVAPDCELDPILEALRDNLAYEIILRPASIYIQYGGQYLSCIFNYQWPSD